MAISLRLNKEETALFQKYAALNKMTVSDLIRQSVMERIENEYDLSVYEKAMAEFQKNPVLYTLDEVETAVRESDV